MNEIEKMYENCGIYPDCRARECGLDYCANSSGCGYAVYPDFTAEKQLTLIVLLANREIRISPTYISSGYYLNNLNKIKSSRNIFTFADSLAQHINAIWKDLTEEEKQQIKELLDD